MYVSSTVIVIVTASSASASASPLSAAGSDFIRLLFIPSKGMGRGRDSIIIVASSIQHWRRFCRRLGVQAQPVERTTSHLHFSPQELARCDAGFNPTKCVYAFGGGERRAAARHRRCSNVANAELVLASASGVSNSAPTDCCSPMQGVLGPYIKSSLGNRF